MVPEHTTAYIFTNKCPDTSFLLLLARGSDLWFIATSLHDPLPGFIINMNNDKNRLDFINVFPTIIGKHRLPENYLALATSVTDKLIDNSELTDNLDYSGKTTTAGGKQVILFGDGLKQNIELKDPAWHQKKR